MKQFFSRIFILALLISSHLESTVVVQGDSMNPPYGFTTDINANTFDLQTGAFFVGLVGNGSANAYTISRASRPSFTSAPRFLPVLNPSSSTVPSGLLAKTIELLILSPQLNLPSVLVCVEAAFGTLPGLATSVFALFSDDTAEAQSAVLNDAAGAQTGGVIAIAANNNTVFAAVKANGASTFGDPGSGIAVIGLGTSTGSIVLDVKNAVIGNDGNLAQALNGSSTVLTGGGLDVLITDTTVALSWDYPLQRLFIGVALQNQQIAKSVVVGQISTAGALALNPIAPNSAISGIIDEIVVSSDASALLNAKYIRVMHTSTGPDYLIVNCPNTPASGIAYNRVFALPLVNDVTNPASSTNGTLANVHAPLDTTTNKFTVPATAPGDLAFNNATTSPAAVVGAGDLPILADDNISNMVVVGDAVYVSIAQPPTVQNDTGIFYSQALFDNTGKIVRWTPWAKRGVPINAFPGITLPGGTTHNGSIQSFSVDASTGNIWIVEGTTSQVVGITSWTTGVVPTDLITAISNALYQGCLCVLDLDQATRGFLGSTTYRYALFGGTNKVAFAVTSIATQLSNPESPQTAIIDYTMPTNFLLTSLPEGAGCCQVLEYSRTSTTAGDPNNLNYFFAGTQNGLYVFTDSGGNGFNIYGTGALNTTPFSSRSWQQVSTISGSVIDLKTSGADRTLYVLTLNSTAQAPLASTLYSIPFQPTTSAMFATGNIRTIAQTGTGVFANIVQFSGIQIIATDDPDTANPEAKEQLVLATDQGLFTSNADQTVDNGIESATNQTAAHWTIVASGDNTTAQTAFYGIAGVDTPVRNTVWPISIEDQYGYYTFDRGSINQFSGVGDPGGTQALFNSFFIPLEFNANPLTPAFTTLDPIIYFFTDGGRRFFIFNRVQDVATQVRLAIIPYNITPWLVAQSNILSTPTLNTITSFYWVKQIGATGILLAGTGSGVVGLQ